MSNEREIEIPKSKIIIAAPTFHSQKPCLKGKFFIAREKFDFLGLFDEILPTGYRACELYARNLVEGWMSVGDECLKFMNTDKWRYTRNRE